MKPIVQDAPGISYAVGRKAVGSPLAGPDRHHQPRDSCPRAYGYLDGPSSPRVERRQISTMSASGYRTKCWSLAGAGCRRSSVEYVFDGTLKSLINLYQTDPDSSYHKKQYAVRKNHDTLYRRIDGRHGHEQLADIKARLIIAWNKEWTDDGGSWRPATPSAAGCASCSASAPRS
jgi:hypothetical protein